MPPARSSIVFLVHAGGSLNAVVALLFIWSQQTIFKILFGDTGWLVLFVAVAAISLFGILEAGRAVVRLKRQSPEPDFGLRMRTALYFAAICLVIHVAFLVITVPEFARINLAIAYGVYLLWLRMLPKLRRTVPAFINRGLDVMLMNVVIVLLLAEVLLRIVATAWPSPLMATSSTIIETRRAGQRYGPGTEHYGFPLNRSGHFDSEFLERSQLESPLVVSIGDSFSRGSVPHPFHYTTVAEREVPGLTIYNMGYPALGPPDYQFLLSEEALQLQPDLIVIALFMGNDFIEGRRRGAAPKVQWYDAERYLVSVVWARIRTLIRDDRIDWRGRIRDAVPGSERAGVNTDQGDTLDELLQEHPWLGDPLLEKPTFTKELFLNIELQRAQTICGTDEAIYTDFYDALDEIVRAAQGVPVAFMLIPDEFQVEDSLWEEIVELSDSPLDRDRPQREIVQWMESRGYPVLDLLPLLRNAPPLRDDRQHMFHLQDTHFNARGNEYTGKAVASFVTSLLADPTKFAKPPNEVPVDTPSRVREQISKERAVEVVAAYGSVLNEFANDQGKAVDASRLAHPKQEVQSALTLIWKLAAPDSNDKTAMRAALMRLADFQEGVGPNPMALDSTGLESTRMRERIALEREELSASLH